MQYDLTSIDQLELALKMPELDPGCPMQASWRPKAASGVALGKGDRHTYGWMYVHANS